MPTDRTFTLTIEQIKDIYLAGIRRGEEVECAYQCGSGVMGKTLDYCVDALYDIVNDGIKWGEEGFTDYTEIESWFK